MIPTPRALPFVALSLASLLTVACVSNPTSLDPEGPAVQLDRDGLAVGGFDPVAYFKEGRAAQGKPEWRATHGGATYQFASEEHRDAFVASPTDFLPAYGGYCAWAVADGEGSLVEVDPKSFLIQDGRVHLCYDGLLADTRAMWQQRDVDELARAADRNWERIAGTAGE